VPASAFPWVLLVTVLWTAFLTYRDLYKGGTAPAPRIADEPGVSRDSTTLNQWSNNSNIANHIYHSQSKVSFCDLSQDNRIVFTLTFFNASNEVITLDNISGCISYEDFSNAGLQPLPRLGQAKTSYQSLNEFTVVIEQNVTSDLANALTEYLSSNKTFTISMEDLVVSLLYSTITEPFRAHIWQGIVCQKLQEVVVCRKMTRTFLVGAMEFGESR
jgi:hypothetical protein